MQSCTHEKMSWHSVVPPSPVVSTFWHWSSATQHICSAHRSQVSVTPSVVHTMPPSPASVGTTFAGPSVAGVPVSGVPVSGSVLVAPSSVLASSPVLLTVVVDVQATTPIAETPTIPRVTYQEVILMCIARSSPQESGQGADS